MQLPGGKEVPGIVIAVSLLIIGAGAAAGAATGTISGDSTTEVEAALEVDGVEVVDASGFGVIGDDGTSFVTTAQTFQGDSYDIEVDINNQASDSITAKLVLKNTGALHVDVSASNTGNNIEVGQVGNNEYLIEIPDGTFSAEELVFTVEAGNDIEPGFFEFETEIVPTELDG